MTNTQDILNEREKTHGDFERFADLKAALVDACDDYGDYGKLTNTQYAALNNILTKAARIICGDPNHDDHWDDIAGYAMLGKGRPKLSAENFWCRGCHNQIHGTGAHGQITADGEELYNCDECFRKMCAELENSTGSATINEPKFHCFLCKTELRYTGFAALKLCDSCVAGELEKWEKESAEENSTSSKMEHVGDDSATAICSGLKEENEQLKEKNRQLELDVMRAHNKGVDAVTECYESIFDDVTTNCDKCRNYAQLVFSVRRETITGGL
jgi:hypothetical protein